MNRTVLPLLVGLLFCILTASAQRKEQETMKIAPLSELIDFTPKRPPMSTDSAVKSIGKNVYIFDTVWGVKSLNDSLKLLYVGGLYPNQKLTMLIKGVKVIKELSYIHNGSSSVFSGNIMLYQGKPAMEITDSFQLAIQIQL